MLVPTSFENQLTSDRRLFNTMIYGVLMSLGITKLRIILTNFFLWIEERIPQHELKIYEKKSTSECSVHQYWIIYEHLINYLL